jgi:RNA polymerase sigma factor (sigma-70 family)
MASPSFDESQVWDRARSGDPAAFKALFDVYRDRVFGQALRHARSVHDAEDITALVFLETWRRRSTVRVVDGSIVGWLLVTTNNVANNFARAKRRYRLAMARIPQPDPQPDFSSDLHDRLDDDGRRAIARRSFAQLSQKDQDVISLCVIEEMSTTQAAQTLGIPAGTVKSRLSRAKDKLAALMAESAESSSDLGGAL